MAQGEDGFNKHTQNILETTQIIAKGVREIQGLRLLGGTPEAMIVCFAGKKYNFWVIWFYHFKMFFYVLMFYNYYCTIYRC